MFYQAAGIPFRTHSGKTELLIITNNSGDRWIFPKGLIDEGFSKTETVEKEAFEEAGITGKAMEVELGKYTYDKWGDTCEVVVVPMKIEEVLKEWPEDYMRRRRWISVDEMNQAIDERIPRKILAAFRKWHKNRK